jgi:hypothetical protein
MKLEKVLDKLGALEKNAFLKIIDTIISQGPKNAKQIERILSDQKRDLKVMETANIVEIFELIQNEFREYLESELLNTTSQLDLLSDILIRDGNSKMQIDWFARLYETEIKSINKKSKEFAANLGNESSEISQARIRDYKIYKSCLETAYTNDDQNNQSRKISWDEQTILNTLSSELALSHEELKLINNLIIKVELKNIQDVINDLKTIGVVFFSKKTQTIFVADEIVRILRNIRGKDVSDKHFRRVLRVLKPSQLNQICRNHGLNWKETDDKRINDIIDSGVSLRKVLEHSVHKENTNLTEKKKFINDLSEKSLKIKDSLKGTLLEEKVTSLLDYFEKLEKDEKVGISIDGYQNMLSDINQNIAKANDRLRQEFQLQDTFVLEHELLLDYNIKPRDVLELLQNKELLDFCTTLGIKSRGDLIDNILDAYKDSENLYIENYENIGYRNLKTLKENGINIHEANFGVKFEEITKKMFTDLGFVVDESLRKSVNTSKNQMDILIRINERDVILVECKTVKESGYNKFSTVLRQLKSYTDELEKKDLKVIKSLLIAPDFSEDFINECNLHYEINLSLLKASSLLKIHQGFKKVKIKKFPHNLIMKDTVIDENRIIQALNR